MSDNARGARRRVVITGIGVVSALGNTTAAFWKGILQGRCGIERLTLFEVSGYRSQLGAQVRDLEAGRYLPAKSLRRMSQIGRAHV